jgi:DNA polymerase beta
MTDLNKTIIDQFELLIKQIKFDIDFTTGNQRMINTYRLRSIEQVLKILKNFPDKITKVTQLKNIKNVGEKSLARIDEILKTGKLSEIKISSDIDKYLQIITELEDVIGIGRKKAYELFKKYDIQSIKDLQSKHKKGLIDLPDNIVKGLFYVGKIQDKIPRSEIDSFSVILYETAIKIDPQLFVTICGSYRRQNRTSGDIDLIMVHPHVKTLNDVKKINYIEIYVGVLKQKGIIIDSLTSDDVYTKYMGICKLGKDYPLRRIDIRYMPYESYYSAILYFTGAKDFNRKMRHIADDMGYTLNEYGLFDENNHPFVINSEKDIFDILSMEYLTPDKRK